MSWCSSEANARRPYRGRAHGLDFGRKLFVCRAASGPVLPADFTESTPPVDEAGPPPPRYTDAAGAWELAPLKAKLLRLVTGLDRGFGAGAVQRSQVEDAAKALEEVGGFVFGGG